MSNGETLKVLAKMVEQGEELSVKQFRQFMIAIAMEARGERKDATKERRAIKTLVYTKYKELNEKIECLPDPNGNCQLANDLQTEMDIVRHEEIPSLRRSSRITDALLVVGTFISGALGLQK